ncbi:MAG: DoxX family protein [Acidobacteria bacterium]|nr:DoxX family protein [Acidobacteriota bacterium]
MTTNSSTWLQGQTLAGDKGAVRDRLARLGPLLLRGAHGLVFVAHALAKALIYTFPGTVAFFEAAGFPGWTAYPVFALELLGGLALLAGYRVRAASLALAVVMVGAASVHVPNGWMFTSPNGGWEYPVFLVVTLLAQALLGPGACALRRG